MNLLLLAPCDRILQDPTQGVSLINVFHGLMFKIPEGIDLPKDAVMPKEWTIFSKWELGPEEVGKDYISRVQIFWPDGTEFLKSSLTAMQPTRDGMSFTNQMNTFPVGQAGKLRVVQTLESDGVTVYGPTDLSINVIGAYKISK